MGRLPIGTLLLGVICMMMTSSRMVLAGGGSLVKYMEESAIAHQTKIGNIRLARNYEINFDIKTNTCPTTGEGYKSILLLSTKAVTKGVQPSMDCADWGDCIPRISLKDNKMQFDFGTTGGGSLSTINCTRDLVGKWVSVKVQQSRADVKEDANMVIRVGGVTMKTTTKLGLGVYPMAGIYRGSPWSSAANATMRNLTIYTDDAKHRLVANKSKCIDATGPESVRPAATVEECARVCRVYTDAKMFAYATKEWGGIEDTEGTECRCQLGANDQGETVTSLGHCTQTENINYNLYTYWLVPNPVSPPSSTIAPKPTTDAPGSASVRMLSNVSLVAMALLTLLGICAME